MLNREEFVVVGWTDPEGTPISGLRCSPIMIPMGGSFTPVAPAPASATRSSNGCGAASSRWRRPICRSDVPPPRDSRFGSPLILSRVHWVRPELVAEVEFLTWTEDNLLRQVVYEGLREDKPSTDVRRPIPHPQPGR